MSIPAVYAVEAEQDIVETHDSYEALTPGLGDRFSQAVRDRVGDICNFPQLYGAFRSDIRAAPVPGFPHVIYYRDRGTDVLIIAVQHGRRSTRSWIGRV